MGIRELFLEIFKRYPAEFNADPKIKTNSYYNTLKEEIRRTFAPFLKFQIEIDALGEFMRKQPYICFLAKGHQRDRGMYPMYLFDFDKKTVLLEFENGNDSPEFTEAFAARAAELLPEFEQDHDGYPRKMYAKDRLDENELVNDLREVFQAYETCLEEFDEAVQEYLVPSLKSNPNPLHPTNLISPTQMDKLWQRFHQRIPGFTDFTMPGEAFLNEEILYKRRVLQRYQNELGNHGVAALLQEGKGLFALKEIDKRLTSNMVQYNSWRQSIGETDEQAAAILQAFCEVAQQPYQGAQTLEPIFRATTQHGLTPSWDTLSVLLWAMRPSDYAPIKISYYRALAKELEQPLPEGRPTSERFDAALQWMRAFYHALEPYHPADWVDVQSFIWCVCPTKPEAAEIIEPVESAEQPRYWAIAPGENARLWDDFKQNNIIAIGWDKLGDFLQYPDKEAIRQSLQQLEQTDGYKTNDTLACYEFAYVMKIGDYVLAKKGLDVIIGFGQITSDYIYDDSRTEYHHVREVRWFAYGEWKIPEGVRTIIPKTLTNITTYKERLQKILDLIHVPSHAQIDKPNTPSALTPKPPFSKADALAKLFLSDAEFDDILDLLCYKKNIILQGPPGVGKSFIAKQIAFALL